MRREFDIFEKFPDGSTVWRICVCGRYETERKLHSLSEHSENEFYAIEIPSGAYVTPNEVKVKGELDMPIKRYKPEQIVTLLRQIESAIHSKR